MRSANLRTKVVVSTALAFMGANLANAQQFPQYDVDHYCEKIARFSGTSSARLKSDCIKQERNAHAALDMSWDRHPSQVLAECIYVFGGEGSYTVLLACIQQEMKARFFNAR